MGLWASCPLEEWGLATRTWTRYSPAQRGSIARKRRYQDRLQILLRSRRKFSGLAPSSDH